MRKIIQIVLLLVVIIDLGIVNYFVFFNKSNLDDDKVVEDNSALITKIEELENRFDEIENQEEEVVEVEVTPTEVEKVVINQIVNKSKHVNYVNITGNFSQVAYDWTDVPVSEFYFNKADYVGLTEVKFESNMKLLNGNGMAFVRLFDVTHGVAVTKSQVQTAYQNDTVVISEPINFMDGNNLIRVQIKSLTADSTVFNSGRLVISSEY